MNTKSWKIEHPFGNGRMLRIENGTETIANIHGDTLEETLVRAEFFIKACDNHDNLLAVTKRLYKLASLVTVKQAITNDCADAAGLNPWCINEGLAIGDKKVDLRDISDIIEQAE